MFLHEKEKTMFSFKYTIKRKNKNFARVSVKNTGEVVLECYRKMTDEQIIAYLKEREEWIEQTIKKLAEMYHPLTYGEKVLYLGKEYLIKETPSKDAFFDEDSFYINQDQNIFKTLSNTFEKEAYKIIGELLEKKSKEMNLHYNSYRITSAKYQVGACKKKITGNDAPDLVFSWRLVSCPMDVIEYVVVHELAHIKEHNHENTFWEFVEKYIPNYKKLELQLDEIWEKVRHYCL